MDGGLGIVRVEDIEQARSAIGGGLHEYNQRHAGDNRYERVCFALTAPDGAIAGGVVGELYWGWLFIELLWLRDDLRGQGYGHRLLETIEDAARQRGARHAYLDTFSFQAPDFYRRHGYRPFGELEDFPPGFKRLFFTKDL